MLTIQRITPNFTGRYDPVLHVRNYYKKNVNNPNLKEQVKKIAKACKLPAKDTDNGIDIIVKNYFDDDGAGIRFSILRKVLRLNGISFHTGGRG